jgi:hypothetical protein
MHCHSHPELVTTGPRLQKSGVVTLEDSSDGLKYFGEDHTEFVRLAEKGTCPEQARCLLLLLLQVELVMQSISLAVVTQD